jgi:hypothetical protein
MVPLGTSLQGEALHMKDGVVSGIESLGEFLHIIIWHLCLLLVL